MSEPGTCPREPEVVDAIRRGGWPVAVDAALVGHATSCRACAETVLVALALEGDRRSLSRGAGVPPAALVFLRAQQRARAEAQRVAERPLRIAHAVALACLAGVLASIVPQVIDRALEWVAWAGTTLPLVVADAKDVVGDVRFTPPGMLLALMLAAALAPLVIYLSFASE